MIDLEIPLNNNRRQKPQMKKLLSATIAMSTIALIAFVVISENVYESNVYAAPTNIPQENQQGQTTSDGIKVEFGVPSKVYATELTPVTIKVTDANSGANLSHVDWAIVVKDSHGNVVYKTTTAHSHVGIMDFNVAFPIGGENTVSLTSSSIGSKMMGMDVPLMARTHTMTSGSPMTFEKDSENNFGSRTFEYPVYVLPQKQTRILDGSEKGTKVNVELSTSSNEIIAGQPATLILTVTQPNGEMLTHPDALISVRRGSYMLSNSAEPGDPMMPMNGAYHGHLGQMSYTATFPSAGNYIVNVDLSSLPVSNYQFGHTSARFNILVSDSVGDTAGTLKTAENHINILGLESPFYSPNGINVKAGTTLTFDNTDGNFHTVTSGTAESGPDGKFDSSLLASGQSFDVKLDKPGTYNYFCTIHTTMRGTVTVS
jgi:plastocyanin